MPVVILPAQKIIPNSQLAQGKAKPGRDEGVERRGK